MALCLSLEKDCLQRYSLEPAPSEHLCWHWLMLGCEKPASLLHVLTELPTGRQAWFVDKHAGCGVWNMLLVAAGYMRLITALTDAGRGGYDQGGYGGGGYGAQGGYGGGGY